MLIAPVDAARSACAVAVILTLAAAVALVPSTAAAQDWPGFRGIAGTGVAAVTWDVADLAPAVTWRVEIGIGYSGVAVAGGQAITMFEDGDQVMIALDAATGAELWRRPVGPGYPGRDGSWNGPIATPVIHDNLVVALEPWGRLFALDRNDGEPVWSVHLTDDLGAPRPLYGFASSPLVVGDILIVHGGPEAGALLGFDVATGDLRWATDAEVVDAQSPVALSLAGEDMVVAAGGEHVFGVRPESGEIVWSYAHEGDGFRGQGSLVPVPLDKDRIFLAHSDDASQVIDVRREGAAVVAQQLWLDRTIRNSYTVAVHHEGYIYAYSARIFVCVDAATGELQWRSRQPTDGFITLVGDDLVILTKDGSLHIGPASPEGFDEVASTVVFDELTWTPPSYADGAVFARSLDEIVRVDLRGNDTAEPAVVAATYNVPRSLDPGDGEFGRFVRELEVSPDPDALITDFFERHPQMPLIEGERRVHFLHQSDDGLLTIAGDFIGARQEAPMTRVGDTDLFYFSTEIEPDARVAYVFKGDTATVPDPLNPLRGETLIFDADREWNFGGPPLEVSDLRMPAWELPAHLREPDPGTARGRLDTLELAGTTFGDVAFRVYLPPGYDDGGERYPVLYYHGQTPTELSALPRSLDNLIADGMRPAIAVYAESFLPPAPVYTDFWAEELVPAVDGAYRTIASADGRVGAGGALGTLQALFIAFARPEMSSGVAVQTMFFLDTDWDMLRPFLARAEERPLRIYMDWGTYDIQNPQEAWDGRVMSRQYWAELESLGYQLEGGEAPDGTGWLSWRNRTDAVLRAILPPQ